MEPVIFGLTTALLVGGLALRWRYMTSPVLTRQEFDQFRDYTIEYLLENVDAPGVLVKVHPSFWGFFEGADSRAPYQATLNLVQRGTIECPEVGGALNLLIGQRPASLALTSAGIERYNERHALPAVIIVGDVRIESINLPRLAGAFRQDADNLDSRTRDELLRAADNLERGDEASVRSAVSWFKTVATQAAGGAAGNALFAASLAVWNSIVS